MRRKLVAGNWKMNGGLAANAELLAGIKAGLDNPRCDIAVCVPSPYLSQCAKDVAGSAISLGAQDVSAQDSGAYTGETSAKMLLEFGCRYAIVGHSERRSYHGETDEAVAQKTVRAIANGVVPIVCVGETLSEREAGKTNDVVGRQVDAVLAAIGADGLGKIVIAYEPVWAIGTGKTATPEMAQEVHAEIRAKLVKLDAQAGEKVQILYGGSMKPDNAKALMSMADIDGGLIGGASLKAADFLAIIAAA
ncbi:MAG: triose-phosphate isomerase [Paucimonas sp.]|jgi:triosephosphate isomerase|nr:triose-phosphate isomerase [Paucimonas sp.]